MIFTPPQRIPGMTAWVCEYDGPDGRYSIVLHGSDPQQILDDNCDLLPGLKVMGEHGGTVHPGGDDHAG
jgi:hypothetical protein